MSSAKAISSADRASLSPTSTRVLKEAGGTIDNLVMTTTYIVDRKYRDGYNEVRMQTV